MCEWKHKHRLQRDVFGNNSVSTKAAVLRVVPVGSKIDHAKQVMESEGLRCVMQYNQKYAEDDPNNTGKMIDHPPADFLWCDSGERSTWMPLVSKRWQIAFVVKDDKVAAVSVGVGVTGP
jgi:hypothetical protein